MDIERIRDLWVANDSDLLMDYAFLEKRNIIKCTYILKIASDFSVQNANPKLFVTSLLVCLN